jgi:hypothetical protein
MTTYTYSTNANDSYATVAGPLVSTSTVLSVAGNITYSNADTRTYIPFVVAIPQGKQIVSATLRWVATDTRTELFNIGIACEAADNSSVPADSTALYAKSLTTGTTVGVPAYTDGVEYSNTVTTSVQAVISRAGWVAGNTLAIIIDDAGATGSQRREVAGFEHATYAEAKLDIVIKDLPRAGMIV